MKTNSLFYRLFQSSPSLVLELVGLDYSDAQAYRFCSKEIKQTIFRLNRILAPATVHSELPLIFAEVQFQLDTTFTAVSFAKSFFFLNQNSPKQPWQAFVIYPTRQVETDGACIIHPCSKATGSNLMLRGKRRHQTKWLCNL